MIGKDDRDAIGGTILEHGAEALLHEPLSEAAFLRLKLGPRKAQHDGRDSVTLKALEIAEHLLGILGNAAIALDTDLGGAHAPNTEQDEHHSYK